MSSDMNIQSALSRVVFATALDNTLKRLLLGMIKFMRSKVA